MEFLAHAGLSGLVVALKATAILAGGFLVFGALQRRSASARHLVALLALLGAALVPLLTPVLPRWEWRILPVGVRAAGEQKIFSEGEEGKPRRSTTLQPGSPQLSKNAARSAGPVALFGRLGPSGVALPVEATPARRRPVSASDVLAGLALLRAL